MRIGILGAGRMTRALSGNWVRAGHEVMIAGRSPEKAARLPSELGARTGTLAEAAAFGEIVLLAVRYEGVDSTLVGAGAANAKLADKVLIDCNNPVEVERFTLVRSDEGSLAQHIAAVSGARVVKAFNLAHFSVWRDGPRYGGRPLTVPIAGDEQAKPIAAELVEAVGGTALDAGGLEHAAYLEAMGAVVIRALFGGADPTTTFQLAVADGIRVGTG